MKYHYEPPDIEIPIYGEPIELSDHPIYKAGTLYLENGRGLIVTQQVFNGKICYWDSVQPAIANDIYLSPYFHKFFMACAKEKDYPIFQLRKIMWALKMKPLKREQWEDYFGVT